MGLMPSTPAKPATLNLQHAWVPYAFLTLPTLLLIGFFLVPMGWALWMSMLDDSHQFLSPTFVGLQNYSALFHSPRFWRVLWNTAWFTVCVVPAMVILPIPVALLLNQALKGMGIFRTLIYLPVVVSLVVTALAWKWLLAPSGLINYGLSFLHIPPLDWLVSPDLAMIAISIMVVWKGLGYYMMMYLASLQSLSPELYEAAEVDGASLWERHWHVSIPHLRPTMALVAIISTIGALKAFTEMYVMTRGGPVGSTETVAYYIYEQAFGNLNLGLASAAGVVLMLIIFALSWVNIQLNYNSAEADAQHA